MVLKEVDDEVLSNTPIFKNMEFKRIAYWQFSNSLLTIFKAWEKIFGAKNKNAINAPSQKYFWGSKHCNLEKALLICLQKMRSLNIHVDANVL